MRGSFHTVTALDFHSNRKICLGTDMLRNITSVKMSMSWFLPLVRSLVMTLPLWNTLSPRSSVRICEPLFDTAAHRQS